MATRKQRRRREKERRHEYETVYVDEQGEEVEVDEPDAKAKSTKPEERKAASGSTGRGRVVDPPSWNKVIRRGSIFAPFIVIFLYLVRPKDASTVAVVAQAVVLIILLVPFMYLVDSMAYRSYEKRMAKRRDTPPKTK